MDFPVESAREVLPSAKPDVCCVGRTCWRQCCRCPGLRRPVRRSCRQTANRESRGHRRLIAQNEVVVRIEEPLRAREQADFVAVGGVAIEVAGHRLPDSMKPGIGRDRSGTPSPVWSICHRATPPTRPNVARPSKPLATPPLSTNLPANRASLVEPKRNTMSRLDCVVVLALPDRTTKLPLISTYTRMPGPNAQLRPAVDREAGHEVAAGHAVAAGRGSCGSAALVSPSRQLAGSVTSSVTISVKRSSGSGVKDRSVTVAGWPGWPGDVGTEATSALMDRMRPF